MRIHGCKRLITKKAILLYSLFTIILVSCRQTNEKFEFEIEYPKNVKVKKDSSKSLYLKVYNSENGILHITNIKSSCNCVILSKKKLKIKPYQLDSIKIELHGYSIGKNYESLVFSNNKIKKFKVIKIKYEVTK